MAGFDEVGGGEEHFLDPVIFELNSLHNQLKGSLP